MLTRELAISRTVQGEIQPDRLTRTAHSEYLALAPKLLSVYETGSGVSRRSLHVRIRDLLMQAPNCPPKRIAAFCKLLDERSEFETDARGEAAKLRQKVFRLAAKYQPITEDLCTLGELFS
ncbi:DUF790 family protein [Pirellulaceae bacterium SH501]